MLCMRVLQIGHSGEGCDLASAFCKYDLRKCDLFFMSWVRWGRSIAANVWWRYAHYFVIASCG